MSENGYPQALGKKHWPFPKLPAGAKCKRCGEQAIVPLPSHNANFCPDCFELFFKKAVVRALKSLKVSTETPLLVAVSGGKDSLALWHILNELGFATRGLHLDLGIPEFSQESRDAIAKFATSRGLEWVTYSLKKEFGLSIPEIKKRLRGKICSACGKIKRYFLNTLTIKEGFDLIATGHNLDDEAGRLLGNLIGHRLEMVNKQYPLLPSPHPNVPGRLKPLFRLEIKEILAYCALKNIVPVKSTCPYSKKASSHRFKKALDRLESEMPGIKRNFLYAYLKDNKHKTQQTFTNTCKRCGQPAYAQICSVCLMKERLF